MTESTTVAIAGGGPAGMVLGLLLARAGVEVTVLEKHADFLRDFRGDTVHPSTIQLLDELGLGEKFTALPQSKLTEVAFPAGDGDPLVFAEFTRLRVPYPYVAMVPQWDLLDLLADAASAEPTFTLRRDTEVTGLIKESGRVRGVRWKATDGTSGELRADLTVGCDGRWSTVREESGLRTREYPVPMDTWWFRLPRRSDEDYPALTPTIGTGQFGVVIPREGYFQLAYLGPKGSDAQFRADGIEAFRERAASLWPWLADRVGELKSMDDVKHLDIRLNRLDRWHADGVLCIGDAAHAMSPIGGVGINLAVQDAVATARLLAAPLLRGSVTTQELAAVRKRRRLPTVLVQSLQRLLHRLVLKPAMEGTRTAPPAPARVLFRRLPWARVAPAYLIGIGVRPEHAPDFARRQPV